MKQTETDNDYYDRIQGLLSVTKHALEKKYTVAGESEIMMKPIIECAHSAFIKCLLDEI